MHSDLLMIVTVGLGLFFCDGVRAEVGKAIPLWQGEVPGEKGDIPAESIEVGGGIRRVSNVSIPRITVYPAPLPLLQWDDEGHRHYDPSRGN